MVYLFAPESRRGKKSRQQAAFLDQSTFYKLQCLAVSLVFFAMYHLFAIVSTTGELNFYLQKLLS
jgi:hypothetical protein